METVAVLGFAAIGAVLLFNVAGAADVLAAAGRKQRARRGPWWTAGTPQSCAVVRLLGAAWLVICLGIAAFPPT